MSLLTGQLFWDPAGGVLVGALLCVVAAFLIKKNRGRGQPAPLSALSVFVHRLRPSDLLLFAPPRPRYFLLSPNIPESVKDRAVGILRADPIVREVFDVKGEQLGPRSLRFKAEVEFDGREIARRYCLARGHTAALAEALRQGASDAEIADFLADFGEGLTDFQALEINRLEAQLQSEMPDLTHIDLESHERTRARTR
eukprot:tig00000382_g24570.t1